MLDTHRDTDFLEDLWMDDCKCESPTHDKGRIICSHDVGYRISWCGPSANLCRAMGEHAKTLVQLKLTVCAGCSRDIAKCWTIRPI